MSPVELLQDELKYLKESYESRKEVIETFKCTEENKFYYERVVKKANSLEEMIKRYEKAIDILKEN
ncbi:hypothetical protein ICU_05157 [Bacillus cereus BAG2X1-1]|nr:hypothetical protein ICU_05157 [Bacillus cereus BAG2X1-1]